MTLAQAASASVITSVIAVSAACSTVHMAQVSPTIPQPATSRTLSAAEKALLCTEVPTHAMLTGKDLIDRKTIVMSSLPSALQHDPVVTQVTDTLVYISLTARRSALSRVGLNTSPIDEELKTAAKPGNLSNSDFRHLAEKLGNSALDPAAQAADPILVSYYRQYYKGLFIDRLGTRFPKPEISRNIADDEIAGAFAILVEFVADQLLSTPIWQDKESGRYYPGGFTDTPTALELKVVQDPTPLLKDAESQKCGITALKAEAIAYVEKAAAARASSAGGLTLGSFGGLHFGFGILGKWSIGDNQTLQVIAKTVLSRAFARLAEQATFEVLYRIGYDPSVGDDITKILDILNGSSLNVAAR